jgi:MFS family permease
MASNVGIKDTNTKLLLNAGYALAGWFAATIGARLHDVFGRRTMLLSSTLGMVVALSIMSGTAAGYVNTHGNAVSSASIAWIFIFGMVFAVGYTAMQPIYVSITVPKISYLLFLFTKLIKKFRLRK